jgi:penicillin-binding protein 1A
MTSAFKNKFPRFKKFTVIGLITVVTAVILISILLLINIRSTLPGMAELRDIRHHQASQVLSSDGEILGSYFFQNRTQVDLQEISPLFVDALLAVEDIRFYEHNGIDRRALARVFVKSILMGQDAGGGSTLTQQLAKNLYPRDGSGWFNLTADKLREMIIAWRIERLYNKDEVLELYLNTVSFGEETFGIETASQRFFSKPSSELELHEAATLAGVLRAPGLYNPHRRPERSTLRRNVVIRQMERYGMISAEEAQVYQKKPLETQYNRITENEGPAPYFREHLRTELQKLLQTQPALDGNHYNIYTDGLTIQTTIDSRVQAAAEQAMADRMRVLQFKFDARQQENQILPDNDPAIVNAWKNTDHYQRLVADEVSEEEIGEIFHTPRKMTVFTWDGEKEKNISPHDSLRHYLSFLNSGFMAMSPDNGEVLAWVGGIKHKYFQFDHVKSRRQTGSAFKPIVYAAALENGMQPCDYQRNLLSTYERHEDRIHAMRYEEIVTKPEEAWGEVFRYLEMPFDRSALEMFDAVRLGGRKGDPSGVKRYGRVSSEPLEGWKRTLDNPVRKSWCRRYLHWIGRDRLAIMGYDLDDLVADLDSLPTSYRRIPSDVGRGCWGIVRDLSEPKILRQKLQKLPAWNRIHVHK